MVYIIKCCDGIKELGNLGFGTRGKGHKAGDVGHEPRFPSPVSELAPMPQSVSIITDFPYGCLRQDHKFGPRTVQTERNLWDTPVDLELFWNTIRRWKNINVVISTAKMPFTAQLVQSNTIWFWHSLVWEKSKATGFLNAKKQPLRAHEDIVLFKKYKHATYNPQMTQGKPYDKAGKINESGFRYPRSVLYFKTAEAEEGKALHPTQKPVGLMEYLIKTYTNEGDTVIDPCMGSGTTGVACMNCGRNFIGFERDEHFFEVARSRLSGWL